MWMLFFPRLLPSSTHRTHVDSKYAKRTKKNNILTEEKKKTTNIRFTEWNDFFSLDACDFTEPMNAQNKWRKKKIITHFAVVVVAVVVRRRRRRRFG